MALGKNPPASTGDIRDTGSIPGSRKILCRRVWQPTLVFLPGEAHGQRSLTGYSPEGHKELEMTGETLHTLFHQANRAWTLFLGSSTEINCIATEQSGSPCT